MPPYWHLYVSAWCKTCPDWYILVRYLWSLTCKRRSELFHSASAVNTCKAIFSTPHGASSLSWNGSCGKSSWNGIPKPLPKSTNIIQYHSHSFYLILILIVFSAKTSWNFHPLTSSAHISLDLRASANQATPHRLLCPAGGCQGRSDHPQQRGSHIERWPATGRGGEVCLFLFRQRQEQKGFGVQTIGHLNNSSQRSLCTTFPSREQSPCAYGFEGWKHLEQQKLCAHQKSCSLRAGGLPFASFTTWHFKVTSGYKIARASAAFRSQKRQD